MTLEPRGDVVRLSAGNWVALLGVFVPVIFAGAVSVLSMKSDLAVLKSTRESDVRWQERMEERVLRIERIVKQP